MGLSENKPVIGYIIQGDGKADGKVNNNNNIKKFTEYEIEKITSNYSNPIGKGGFGEVYRGALHDDDHDLVAVKRYIRAELREEFMEEVSIHSQINHKNAVKLIGYCIGENTLTMVAEYISKGNLEDTLHNSDISIPLDTRLGIAIGCAEAFSYMHSMHLSSDNLVCHGDIKPANILLDENLTAKVSDFGLSRLLLGGITRYTSNVKGSLDYMDPIYLQQGCLTAKNDVYSFGAVLLELIARKKVKEGNISLIGTFREACAKGKGLRKLFDAEIAEESNMKILEEIGKLATECLTMDIHKRPGMNDVARRLVKLWKALREREGNIFWPFFSSEGGNRQGTSSAEILTELGNTRIFTKGELNNITHNYSYPLRRGWTADVYKGTLEDNTLVVVKKSSRTDSWHKYIFGKEAKILSQIVHKNIIKLLGCCLEDEIPILLYEYAASKRNLYDILHINLHSDFPLELRLNIAVQTAEALAYLHSSAAGVIRHGSVKPSAILVDDNFIPKLSDFSSSMKVTKDTIYLSTGLLPIKSDVYNFGIVLLELISRMKFHNGDDLFLINRFIEAYKRYDSGKKLFDKEITAQEDITVLEEIGRLALECFNLKPEERPTMEEVAEHLEMLRSSWKKGRTAKGAELHKVTQVEEATAVDISGTEDTTPDAPLDSQMADSLPLT